MHEFYEGNKVECFNMWLDSGKEWDQVKIKVDRLHEQRTEAKRGMVAMQGKDIKKNHSEEKAQKIIAARKAAGLWYPSDDFEEDDDETYKLER